MAFFALWARKARSGLTVVSILLGAFSIVTMISLADSGLSTMMKDVEDLGGARLMLIEPSTPDQSKGKSAMSKGYLTRDDIAALKIKLTDVAAWSYWTTLNFEGNDVQNTKGIRISTDILATDRGFFDVFGMTLKAGRFYSDDDVARHARVCVIATDVSERLFDGGGVGETLSTDGFVCRVVGVIQKKERMGMRFGFEWANFVAAPLTALQDVDATVDQRATLQIKTVDSSKNDITKRLANAILLHRHHGVDDFEIFDFSSITAKFESMFLILQVVVGLIASIALVVGGVGVMNMMFVSVSERKREIGIRKALGASPRIIAMQFIVEAVLLGGSGGALGVAFGAVVTTIANWVIAQAQPAWVGVISVPAVLVALSSSLLTGLAFGTVPAKSAAALDAVVAIRS